MTEDGLYTRTIQICTHLKYQSLSGNEDLNSAKNDHNEMAGYVATSGTLDE